MCLNKLKDFPQSPLEELLNDNFNKTFTYGEFRKIN